MRVLVVDDDPVVRRVLSRALRWRGHETEEAGTVDAGIDRLLRGGIDVVVVDFELPDATGADFAREALSLLRTNTPPLVLASASVERVGTDDRALFGAIHRKPIGLLQLLDDAERLVRGRRAAKVRSGTGHARPSKDQDDVETLIPPPKLETRR